MSMQIGDRVIPNIKIGNITLKSNVFLAPMSGVSDLPNRFLIENYIAQKSKRQVGLVVSEMVASNAMQYKDDVILKKSDITNSKIASVQLAGYDPIIMGDVAKQCEDNGADIIDINFGCPAKRIVNNYSGSALMKDVDRAVRIMDTVVRSVNIPVTVKMRIGWDFNNLNAPDIAKKAEDLGVQLVTVHGRTRSQFFTGKADWSFVKNVKDAVNIPVIVNGDIVDIYTAKQAMIESGADGVMIGRGAYGKPWLPAHIAAYLHDDIIEDENISGIGNIIEDHLKSIVDYYGEIVGVRYVKKHLSWYSKNFKNAISFRMKVNYMNNLEDILREVRSFFTFN